MIKRFGKDNGQEEYSIDIIRSDIYDIYVQRQSFFTSELELSTITPQYTGL